MSNFYVCRSYRGKLGGGPFPPNLNIVKRDQSKIRSFNWYCYVINGRKGIKGGKCHAINGYMKGINEYMKD